MCRLKPGREIPPERARFRSEFAGTYQTFAIAKRLESVHLQIAMFPVFNRLSAGLRTFLRGGAPKPGGTTCVVSPGMTVQCICSAPCVRIHCTLSRNSCAGSLSLCHVNKNGDGLFKLSALLKWGFAMRSMLYSSIFELLFKLTVFDERWRKIRQLKRIFRELTFGLAE